LRKKSLIGLIVLLMLITTAAAYMTYNYVSVNPASALLGGNTTDFFKSKTAADRIADVQSKLTSNPSTNNQEILNAVMTESQRFGNYSALISDYVNNIDVYVKTIAKSVAADSKLKNETSANATSAAQAAVDSYYSKAVSNIVYLKKDAADFAEAIVELWLANGFDTDVNNTIDVYTANTQYRFSVNGTSIEITDVIGGTKYQFGSGIDYFRVVQTTTTVGGKNYTDWELQFSKDGITYENVDTVIVNNDKTIYDTVDFDMSIMQLDSAYLNNTTVSTIVNNVYNVTINASVVRADDLSNQLTSSFGQTEYYAYYAAELALLGFEGNLNYTFTVQLDSNTTVTGYLFADGFKDSAGNATSLIEKNKTYTVAFMGFIVTDTNKVYRLFSTENFTVTAITRVSDNSAVQNVTVKKYVAHSGNQTDIDSELSSLYELYQIVATITPPAVGSGGGGSGGAVGSSTNQNTALVAVILLGGAVAYAFSTRSSRKR